MLEDRIIVQDRGIDAGLAALMQGAFAGDTYANYGLSSQCGC